MNNARTPKEMLNEIRNITGIDLDGFSWRDIADVYQSMHEGRKIAQKPPMAVEIRPLLWNLRSAA
jgi:hypothetical protein